MNDKKADTSQSSGAQPTACSPDTPSSLEHQITVFDKEGMSLITLWADELVWDDCGPSFYNEGHLIGSARPWTICREFHPTTGTHTDVNPRPTVPSANAVNPQPSDDPPGERLRKEVVTPELPHASDCASWAGEECDCVTGKDPVEKGAE